jgi:hypothetical protein
MDHRRKTGLKTTAAVLGLIGILGAARVWYVAEQGNFHPITAGQAYRSAQLARDELEHYIHTFGI